MTTATSRDLMPDLIRAWALIGIALVNVEVFGASLSSGFATPTTQDFWIKVLIAGIFTMKSYSLFSMMFGAGLGYQMDAADRKGIKLNATYFRRMAGLLVLGIIHVVFLFIGDILVTYALLGALLFAFKDGKPKTYFISAIVILVLQIIVIFGMAGMFLAMESITDPIIKAEIDAEMMAQDEMIAEMENIFADGSFFQVAIARAGFTPFILPMVLAFQGLGAFAFFLIGLALVRNGVLRDPQHKFWMLCRRVFLPIGLITSIGSAYLYARSPGAESSAGMFALGLVMAFSAFSTLGYAGLIAKIAQSSGGAVLRFIARGGSATLSAYLMQSVIMSFIFLEYGLGLFGQVSQTTGALIAFGTAVFTLCFVSLWLKAFKRGPMEILLRRWTYLS